MAGERKRTVLMTVLLVGFNLMLLVFSPMIDPSLRGQFLAMQISIPILVAAMLIVAAARRNRLAPC
jgi:hypothetical protein